MGVTRYWVGGSGYAYWDSSNWSDTLGGSSGASVPSAVDDEAIFTDPISSGLTIRTAVSCKITLNIGSPTSTVLTIGDGGTLTLQNDLVGWQGLTLTGATGSGVLVTNNYNISVNNIFQLHNYITSINLGTSVITVGPDIYTEGIYIDIRGDMISAGSATFIMNPGATNNPCSANMGGNTGVTDDYGLLRINLNSSITSHSIQDASFKKIELLGNGNISPGNLIISENFKLTGNTTGGLIFGEFEVYRDLTTDSGVIVDVSNATIQYSSASGGAAFKAMNGCIDGGENTGWTFPQQLYMPLFSLHGELKGTPPMITGLITIPMFSPGVNLWNTPTIATVTMEIPLFQINIEGGSEVNIDLPFLTIYCTAVINPIASVDRYLPKLELAATSYQNVQAQVLSQIPLINVFSTAFINEISGLTRNLPLLEISSSALAGDAVNFNKEIPLLKLDSSAYWMVPGLLDSILPKLKLSASVRVVYSALSFNIRNQALSSYPVFDFNQMTMFNGKSIGISRTGIYELSGTKDDNVDIPWKLRSGKLDLKKNHLRQVWITGNQNGTITLAIEDAEGNRYEYQEVFLHENENELRIKVGKGIKTRYFTLELSGIGLATIDQLRIFGSGAEKKR